MLIGNAAKAGVRFLTYDSIKQVLRRPDVRFTVYDTLRSLVQGTLEPGTSLPFAYSFGLGMAAGIVIVYSTMPLDVVKTRMQGSSPLHAAKDRG
ncbi:hypothetical protein EV182_006957, partial [Spiromyces aspiralis]